MSKSNGAKYIAPAVGAILAHSGNKQSPAPAKVIRVDYENKYVTVFRPGSRHHRTNILFSSLDRYKVAAESDFPLIDFNEVSGGPSTLTDKPFTPPKANDEEPKSEPPPPSAIERQSDISILALFRDIQSDMRREFNERFDKQEQARREETRALHESLRITNATVSTVAAMVSKLGPQALPQSATPPVVESDKDKKDRELKERHKRIFKTPLDTFIASEMVRVDPATESGRSLALESGQFYELFAAWCARRKDLTEKPFQAAIYSLLSSKQHRGSYKVQTSEDKVLTSYAPKSTRQTSINFNDEIRPLTEAMDVIQYARTIWGAEADKCLSTVATLIERKTFTREGMILALGRLIGLKGSDRKYTPSEVFTEENLRSLINSEAKARAGVGK